MFSFLCFLVRYVLCVVVMGFPYMLPEVIRTTVKVPAMGASDFDSLVAVLDSYVAGEV